MVKAKSALLLGANTPAGENRGSVDQGGIAVAIPWHGIWRVAHDGIERLFRLVERIFQCIAILNVEVIIVYIVQEHVHATEVVGFHVDFLTIETILHILGSHHTDKVQEQRA